MMKTITPYRFFLLVLLAFFATIPVFGQTVSFYEEYHGNITFEWFGQTNNLEDNSASGFSCSGDNVSSSSTTITIPTGAVIKKAMLYWSGSGSGDFNIKLSGPGFSNLAVSATKELHASFSLKKFFGGAYDVTSIINGSGSGDYTVSDLDANDGFAHCVFNTVYSGWSILVVYEDASLPFSTVKIYDGFEAMRDESKGILIDNILVESAMETKLGVLVWESDIFFSPGEFIEVNNTKISNVLNPINHIFNQTNSSTGSTSYNMDLDIFDISGFVNLGDTEIPLKITTGGDLIFLNALAVAYQNKLPDATVVIDTVFVPCDNPIVTLTFEVFNKNSSDILPQGTPIFFYKDNTSGATIAGANTLADILIDGSESQTITFPSPGGSYSFIAVVDPSLAVLELNETNNMDIKALTVAQVSVFTSFVDTICDGDSIAWQGIYYSEDVLFIDTFLTTNGCDSIVDWTLTISPKLETMVNETICPSDVPYTLPDGTFANATGLFISVLTGQNGCDSTVIVDLVVRIFPPTSLSVTVCPNGLPYVLPDGTTTDIAGQFTSTLTDQFGCDSTVITDLVISTSLPTSLSITVCPNNLPYVLPDGTTTDIAGQFMSTLTNQYGCDSMVIVDLTIENTEWSLSMEICPGDSIYFDGQYFSRDTTFSTTHTSTIGECDSLIAFSLVVKPWQIDSTFAILCESTNYELPDGKLVSGAGEYRSKMGCNQLNISILSRDTSSYNYGLEDTISVVLGESILLNPQPSFSVSGYVWSPGSYLDCTTCLVTNSTPLHSIFYDFSAKNEHGCIVRESVFVHVILPTNEVFIPNAFSPNNDGHNDNFTVYGRSIKNIKRFEIYNRWGELIFAEKNKSQTPSWDGKYKDKTLDTDVFVYLIEIEFRNGNIELFSGDLTIWR